MRTIALLLVGLLVTSSLTVIPAAASSSQAGSSVQANVQLTSSDFTFYVRGTELPVPFMDLVVKPIDEIFLGEFGPGVSVPYPASVGWLGVLVGGFLHGKFHYPTAQESIRQGHETLNSYIKDVRATDPEATITVVSLSQGSIVTSASALALLAEGFDTTGIRYIAAGNPTRANGGMAARLPFHFEIPGLFSAGGDDITSNPPPTDGAEFTLVTNQYDPFGDMPRYLLKPVALANWALSFFVGGVNAPFSVGFGPHTYDYTQLDPENPAATPGAIVNTYGNQTDVLLPAPGGYLPLTALLRGIVPQKLIDAVDPFLRSIIETAYDRDRGVEERSEFRLVPPKSRWESDIQSVRAGFNQMVNNFREMHNPTLSSPSKSTPVSIPSPIQEADDTTSANTTSSPTIVAADADVDVDADAQTEATTDDANAIEDIQAQDDEEAPVVEPTDSSNTGSVQSNLAPSSERASTPENTPSPIQEADDTDGVDSTSPPVQEAADDDVDADIEEGTQEQEDEATLVAESTDDTSIGSDDTQSEDPDVSSESTSESEDTSSSSRESTDDNDAGDTASSQSGSDNSSAAKSDTAKSD